MQLNALVSGSTRGIGLGIAKALLKDGFRVAINGRDPAIVANLSKELHAVPVPGDVTDPAGCRAVTDMLSSTWSRLDTLICNVGSGKSVPPGSETPDEWDRMLRLNLLSAANLISACEELFPPEGGAIVCVSSICGREVFDAPATYSAAKAALNAYIASIARPLARKNIRINAVAPGNILFEGGTWDRKLSEDRAAVEQMIARDVPLSRFGTVEDVANAVSFLVSPAASFITGSILLVDGGQHRSF